MATAYICDACGETMTDPYKAKMKEFYIGCSYEWYDVFPVNSTRKVKVQLCHECYEGLHMIAMKVKDGDKH